MKTTILGAAILMVLYGGVWLFNHVNPWISILYFVLLIGESIQLIKSYNSKSK